MGQILTTELCSFKQSKMGEDKLFIIKDYLQIVGMAEWPYSFSFFLSYTFEYFTHRPHIILYEQEGWFTFFPPG